MDFRNKIKSYISTWWKNQWKKEIQNEKKKKYLFGWNDQEDTFQRSRNKNIFGLKKEKINVFSSFFQDKILSKNFYENHGYILGIIGMVLIFLTGYIVVFSPYFKISPNQVIVEAVTPGIDIAIAYRVLESTYWESIFLVDEASIAQKLKKQLNNITSISIDSLYPNGIKILITWAPIVFDTTITGIPGKKWWLSKNGVLVPEWDLGDTKIQNHITITSDSLIGDFFLNYKQGISEINMWYISRIYDVFNSEWPDIKITKSHYFTSENEIHLITEWWTKIIFTLQNDADKQTWVMPKYILDQLITLRTYITTNKAKIIDGSIVYIDSRIPWKVFICGDKLMCPKNLELIYWDTYK